MRNNKIKTNVTVLNKLDGRNYKITSVLGSNENIEAVANLINDDETIDENVSVKITDNNAIVFRLIDDPNIPDIPELSLSSGVLVDKDNNPVTEQGSLVIKNILASVPGRVLLAVEPKEPREGYIDLMSYTPETDKFKKLIRSSVPDTSVWDKTDETVRLYYSRTYNKDEDIDGKIVTNTIFDAASILIYDVKDDSIRSTMLSAPIESIINVANSDSIAVISTTIVEDDDIVKDLDDVKISILTNDLYTDEVYTTPSMPEIISYGYRGYVIKTDNLIIVSNKAYKLKPDLMKALGGYNILVDVTSKDYVTRYALVNGDTYNVKTLVVESTRDRGLIISVE